MMTVLQDTLPQKNLPALPPFLQNRCHTYANSTHASHMNQANSRADYLLQRFRAGIASKEEMAELLQLLNSDEVDESLKKIWNKIPGDVRLFDEESSEKMLAHILTTGETPLPPDTPRRKKRLVPALSILVIALACSTWFLYPKKTNHLTVPQPALATSDGPILPGGNKAILILGDSSTILLDSAGNGQIASQGNIQVNKINGEVVYKSTQQQDAGSSLSYNTLRTPKGGQYQLTLADGTKVWMNAASSLRYPTAFSGSDRKVELTGEAYFEVAKDISKPFHVVLDGIEVEVLGTHFNIMAYDNEKAIQTTLLEGAVKLKTAANDAILKPGQQGILNRNAGTLKVTSNVDINQQIAWKNGYFQFNRTDLETIARQLERWYDVDISYEGAVPKREFWGKIPMNVNASEALKILENSDVHYRIEGKKIIFKP